MSRFTEHLYRCARTSQRGMTTGEPDRAVRRSWGEIHRRARHIAAGLAESGIGPGASVAVLVTDPCEIAPLIQAVWMRGAAFTMLHQPTPRTEHRLWLADTHRALALIDADAVVAAAPLGDLVSHRSAVPVLDVAGLSTGTSVTPLEVDEDQAALLQLSSGSTGAPKAVVISHRNLYANVTAMIERFELESTPDQVAVSWLPLFHDMGMIAFLALPMMSGLELVSTTPAQFLRDPLLWVDLITRHRGTFTAAPNFAYTLLARRLSSVADNSAYDLSSMRYAVNGAEPIDCEAMAEFTRAATRFRWPATALSGAYGLAEAVLSVSAPVPGAGLGSERVDRQALEQSGSVIACEDGQRLATLGHPLPGVQVRVVDAQTRLSVPAGRVGEFEIRGECVTSTVLTTEGALRRSGPQSWLATGDLGYLTGTGQLVVCGRTKDVIIVSGRNVFPTDIERAAAQVDGVRPGNAVAVPLAAGTPDEGFAVLVESVHHDVLERAAVLRREIALRVFAAVGVTPRTVRILPVGAIPKTSSGKLRRTAARALATSPDQISPNP